jgi:ribosome maturation factor RimP
LPKPSAPLGKAQDIAARVAAQQGFILVDVELVKESTGRFLRFFLDKPGGVTLDDCEAFHRRVQPMMEFVDYDYMEVSSPGADRPLKKPEDFERAEGVQVEVRLYKPEDGQKVFRGELIGLRDGKVGITDAAGESKFFELKATALVKPVVEFDEEDLNDEI